MHPLACTCGRRFKKEQDLRAHRSSVRRYICSQCNLCLRTKHEFGQHKASSLPACDEKWMKDMVWYCNDCDAKFDDQDALRQHTTTVRHAVEFGCCDCNKSFKNFNALNQHLRDKVHEKRPVVKKLHRCEECDRLFVNAAALDQHLQSTVHRPISNLTCMAGKICGVECNARFKSPSAMIAHMESGSCQSGMNRQKLNRLILVQDNDHLITSSSGIFEYSGWASLENEDESVTFSGVMTPSTDSDEGVLLTPSSSQIDFGSLVEGQLTRRSSSGIETESTTSDSTELSQPKYFFCPLCPDTKRPFLTRLSLEMHMGSAAHTPKMFHCPSILFSGEAGKAHREMKNFSTISGLVAHIESGVCQGEKAGLRTVMEYMEQRLEEMGISFKLLSL
ncbi:hypothetical protein TRIATDRAFT_300854 [Trichoderma atroviride IMI 206040]|uniref:C2H2-type domain-containing protein n=1 Tax=Hypocrea atroviridis (strain ATCC 20476 / IMI 206040) TaxID=452589 RepID=G9P357_HYPAI|nr:uncharacterized protein TRIATDRAFT_300854 [Trichoderma atroviride IMI 206040]EHK42821.1 hypothetical protein TRIATDRAFT_300854 [Trichoderma atroviride IMI 206040]